MSAATKDYEDKMKKTIDNLAEQFVTVRAGRANPHILDKIRVDYYGQPSPLQSVANVSVPEPRIIQIQPWEPSLIKAIEKEINAANLGIAPNNDGKVIRLVFPELTEERRKELTKDIKKMAESAKVAIRNIRRDMTDDLKKIRRIQKGALDFVRNAANDEMMGVLSCRPDEYFAGLQSVGEDPTLEDVKLFGDISFYDEGVTEKLAAPKSMVFYATHPKQMKEDFLKCRWKTGFLKRLFKVKLPYQKLYERLRRIG